MEYEVIGTISHMGSAIAGHNRAYLKHHSKWYLCEDARLPVEQAPIDTQYEQNYCILLKKGVQLRECQVSLECLPNEPLATLLRLFWY